MSNSHTLHDLRDFSVTPRVLPISVLAVVIGLAGTGLAWLLLRLIGLCTNLFFYQRIDFQMRSPAFHHLGWLAALVPVAGGLIVGLMARYGSDRIRGHGIPEAIEAILMNGSRVQPKLAVLKPVSAAIAIGSGGPFGAEGPIIMTGGAVGSMIAQLFHLTSAERKTLLVAGAAAGMAAVFSAPLAAILLATELLLFEFKPRSLIPVALASITAGAARVYILGNGPVFPVPSHAIALNLSTAVGCLACGVLAGFLSLVLSKSIYSVEDWFAKLPLHWMWWPALGGVAVGLGGLLVPRALGVGYDVIGDLLLGHATLALVLSILLVKSAIWIASLGSGTSGGVLAPILMIGGALGGLEAIVFPNDGAGFWPMVSMGAVLAGTLQAPLTAVVFAVELTHDFNMAMPLVIGCFAAYAVMVLSVDRSILTEKIARRGYHLSREYSVDPLEAFLVKEAMNPLTTDQVTHAVHDRAAIARPDETLRTVVYRMVDTGCDSLLVVDKDGAALGVVALKDLLSARIRRLGEERDRHRPLDLRLLLNRARSTADAS